MNEYIDFLRKKPLLTMTGGEFAKVLKHTLMQTDKPVPEQDSNDEYIIGIRALADYLQCSTTKAQQIKNSGKIADAVHFIGKKVYIHKGRLEEIRTSTDL